jgi:hypothetical protein
MATPALEMPSPTRTLTESLFAPRRENPEASSAAFTPPQRPEWFEPLLVAFSSLRLLSDNWDSYGGKKTSFDQIRLAFSIVRQVMPFNAPVPSVVPLGDGGLQLEWHRKQQDLEIVFPADSAPTFYYVNRSTGAEEDGYATDVMKLAKLVGDIA